jgi:hypothetical protein
MLSPFHNQNLTLAPNVLPLMSFQYVSNPACSLSFPLPAFGYETGGQDLGNCGGMKDSSRSCDSNFQEPLAEYDKKTNKIKVSTLITMIIHTVT